MTASTASHPDFATSPPDKPSNATSAPPPIRRGLTLILSGPSGSGKSTLYKEALRGIGGFEFSVSCTTRPMRPGEIDGTDYHFISCERFQELVAEDAFAEHAEVHGNFYGTLKRELSSRMKAGTDVLLDIDVQGAMQLRALCAKDEFYRDSCEFVFVTPPSLAILEQRLRSRGTETGEALEKRLHNASWERSFWTHYDYILINDDLACAVADFNAMITTFRKNTKRFIREPFHV